MLTDIQGGKSKIISLTDTFDLPDWNKSWQGKILFIANPNSPTGGLFSNRKISDICKKFKGIVVLDEAYVDFAESSGLTLLKMHTNLLISRTVSKSYSLAGMRVGWAMGSKELISSLYLTKDSYNVNLLSQIAAKTALEDRNYFRRTRKRIIQSKKRLIKELEKLSFDIYRSDANFIFTSPPNRDGKSLYQYLKKKKILVRFWNLPRLREGARITVGKDHEIDILLKEIKNWMH